MDWLAYVGNVINATDNLDVFFLVLANAKALGIVTMSLPSVNLDHTIQEVSSNWSLPLQVDVTMFGPSLWLFAVIKHAKTP